MFYSFLWVQKHMSLYNVSKPVLRNQMAKMSRLLQAIVTMVRGTASVCLVFSSWFKIQYLLWMSSRLFFCYVRLVSKIKSLILILINPPLQLSASLCKLWILNETITAILHYHNHVGPCYKSWNPITKSQNPIIIINLTGSPFIVVSINKNKIFLNILNFHTFSHYSKQ